MEMRNDIAHNEGAVHLSIFHFHSLFLIPHFSFPSLIFITHFSFLISHCEASAQQLTFVELNCENLFDCRHDSLKQDDEYLPESTRHWTRSRYWRKLNHTGQAILSCSQELPDFVALVEVENDTVLHDLTRRSLLRNAGYDYLMTESPDERGVDVALIYQPSSFRPVCYETITVPLVKGMRPTRDILYVKGEIVTGDTLHVFVVHAPSRYGGERETRPYRMQVARQVTAAIDHLRRWSPDALVLVTGDFNATLKNKSMRFLLEHGLVSAAPNAEGTHGARANYRYQGLWEQIDHVLVSPSLFQRKVGAYVNDAPFLLEEDSKYGGMKPFRTYNGYQYQSGFSDHLPVVVRFSFTDQF